jgi:predicted NBD/HSP70 family sugar kinase
MGWWKTVHRCELEVVVDSDENAACWAEAESVARRSTRRGIIFARGENITSSTAIIIPEI